MKFIHNIKTFFTENLASKDFTLRLSQLASIWDKGLDIFGSGIKKGRPQRPYNQVGWVWLCTNLIIDTCKSIPFLISTSDDELLESGPLYDFIYTKEFSRLLQDTLGYYVLFRECYWVTLDSALLSPTSIIVVGPNSCRPEIRNGELAGYRLSRAGGKTVDLSIEDVFVIKNFNPDDPLHGCGPLTAGELGISTTYQAEQFNEASLANGARISFVLKLPQGSNLKEEEIRKLKSEFKHKHGGAPNAGEPFVAQGIEDITTLSQTMADLQMVDLSKFTAGQICSMFGVPPEIVGLNSEAQYAHGPATQRFILYCISPLLDAIADAIDQGIITKYRFKAYANSFAKSSKLPIARYSLNARQHYRSLKTVAIQQGRKLFPWFDIDSHPALQEMLRERSDKMLSHVEKGVPLNQVISVNDLPYDTSKIPWGEEYLVPMGLVMARDVVNRAVDLYGPALPEGEETPPEKSYEDIPSDKQRDACDEKAEDKKHRIWLKYIASWQPIEKQYIGALRVLFLRQRRELLDKLKTAWQQFGDKSMATGGERQKASDDIIARVVFDLKKEDGRLRVIHQTFFNTASELGIRQSITEISGLKGEQLEAAVKKSKLSPIQRRALAVSSHKLSKVNFNTQNRVANQLKIGLEKGESLSALSKRLQGEFSFSLSRCQRVARTETAGAVSTGRHAGMRAAGVELKSWLTSRDSKVRDAHKAAERQYAKGIPLDEPFIVDSEKLMYPCDPSGSAANIANCRCMQIALAAAGKSFDLDYYDRLSFAGYSNIKNVLSEV